MEIVNIHLEMLFRHQLEVIRIPTACSENWQLKERKVFIPSAKEWYFSVIEMADWSGKTLLYRNVTVNTEW